MIASGAASGLLESSGRLVLGSSWDLVTTSNWAYNPLTISLTGLMVVAPIARKVISPGISSYYVP